MRFFGIVLCLAALGLTGYSALIHKAPEIEADIERRASVALASVTSEGVSLRVDGRHVTLEGNIDQSIGRQDLLDAAAGVYGALGPIDELDQAEAVSPYKFGAVRNADGKVVVEGYAPNADVKASLEAGAKALFGEDVSVQITVADGAPSSSWPEAATIGMDALAAMRQGRLSISDEHVVLEGGVAGQADIDAIDMFASTVPEGYTWAHDVGIKRETVKPFTFSVVKSIDGSLSLTGFAPDEATRSALIEEGEAIVGGQPVVADIQVADGMPDEEWPSLVQAGISAMKDMEAGRFDVVDNDVSFASDPGTEASDTAALDDDETQTDPASQAGIQAVEIEQTFEIEDVPLTDADAALDAAAAPGIDDEPVNQTPSLTIDKMEENVWAIHGIVPDEQSQEILVSLIRQRAGVENIEVELALAGNRPDAEWLNFAADHVEALDVVSAGRLSLEDYEAHLIGVVETPEDVEPVETALAAIDRAMTIDLQPIDPRPAASLDLAFSSTDGVSLNGALPEGLSEGEAMLALGIQRYDGKLEENGRGSLEKWQENLTAIGTILPAFEEIDLSLGGERPTVKGKVHSRDDADAIAREIVLALSDDRQPLVDVGSTTAAYGDGTERINPLTGDSEVFRQGFWLPSIEIAADQRSCQERSSAMLTTDKITFLRGEETLDERAEAILNALAGLAIACLDKTDLVLEIGGHTDSRGAADMNQELSQARADVVLDALTARGVDASSLLAVGYGDRNPVADNATDEGRAANRRITFEWRASADARSADAEG
ncbi:MAG: OmpA family protein [Pseudomonadota bacterium]